MGFFSGIKSIFAVDEDIEDEIYSNYTPPKPPVVPEEHKEEAKPETAAPKTEIVEYPEKRERDDPSASRRTQNQQRRSSSSDRTDRSDRADRSERSVSDRLDKRNNTASDRYSSDRSSARGRYKERESDVRMATTGQSSIDLVLARPNNFKEVSKIGEDINDGRTVILNLELVKQEDATRILDFIWGVAFANEAEIKMMAQKTYAVIPTGVNFSGVDLVSELENNGYSF